jgi:hypothetical protein
LLNQLSKLQELHILWVKSQSLSESLLGLCEALSPHFDVGQDGGLFYLVIDFWWRSFRAAES